MPELSRFFGIVITMYARDHNPAHFHARYGEYEVLIGIESSQVLRGSLPRHAQSMVEQWCDLHRSELSVAWNALRHGSNPGKIAPL